MNRKASVVLVVGCLASAASADVLTYTSQTRNVRATVHQALSDRRDAPDFGPFNEQVQVEYHIDADSVGFAQQNSVLSPDRIDAQIFVSAHTSGLSGSASGDSTLNVEFDLTVASPFYLSGYVVTSGGVDVSNPFASFSLNGPQGNVFNITRPPFFVDFRGPNAITGNLAPGHYSMETSLSAGISNRNDTYLSRVEFAFIVPAPAGGVLLLSSLSLLNRRRRPGGPLMRLFPFPTNPYDDPNTSPSYPDMGPRARSRTAWATFFTPFDLRMGTGDPDLQDTILPETLMIRDLSRCVQWVFGTPPILNADGEVVRSSRRYVRW